MNFIYTKIRLWFSANDSDQQKESPLPLEAPQHYASLAEGVQESRARKTVFFECIRKAVNSLSAPIHNEGKNHGTGEIAGHIRVNPSKTSLFWTNFDVSLSTPGTAVPIGYEDRLTRTELVCLRENIGDIRVESGWYAGVQVSICINGDALSLHFYLQTCLDGNLAPKSSVLDAN